MSHETFEKLKEYSCSQPSGVYEGKMWKSKTYEGKWILQWFGCGKREGFCLNKRRLILVIEKE